jgi:hypothetical protein
MRSSPSTGNSTGILQFSTPIKELSLDLAWNLRRETGYFSRRLSPYVFAGFGLTMLNVRRDWSRLYTEIFPAESDVAKGLAIDAVKQTPVNYSCYTNGRAGPLFPKPTIYRWWERVDTGSQNTDYLDGFRYSANNKRNDSYYGVKPLE